MKKRALKRTTALITACIMIVLGFNTFAIATNQSTTSPDDFFRFISDTKIASNGDFEFSFRNSVTSNKFKPTNTSITVSTIVHLKAYDGTGPELTDPSRTIKVQLYRSGLFNKLIGSYTAAADDRNRIKTFSNLNTNKKYYLVLQSNDPTIGTTNLRFEGTGHVSSIQIV